MFQALDFVFDVIGSAVGWLQHWQFAGVPFLYYLMGITIIGILMRFAL